MKKFSILFILLFAVGVFAQSSAQINRIRGLRNAPIRTAFEAIATGTKTVSGDWTITGDWTINSILAVDSLATDSLNVAGHLVMATTAPIYFRDATEQIYASVNGQLDIDATTEVEIATTTLDLNGALDVSGTITMANGGLISNSTADTLSIDESIVNIGGALTIGTNPTMGITAVDTMGAGRWVKITIAGVVFWAKSDTI